MRREGKKGLGTSVDFFGILIVSNHVTIIHFSHNYVDMHVKFKAVCGWWHDRVRHDVVQNTHPFQGPSGTVL